MEKIHVKNILATQLKKVGKVHSRNNMDILSIQLKTGEQIAEHNAKQTVVIIVRSGEVEFVVEGQVQQLTAEDVLVIEPLENHSLKAITDVDILVMRVVI